MDNEKLEKKNTRVVFVVDLPSLDLAVCFSCLEMFLLGSVPIVPIKLLRQVMWKRMKYKLNGLLHLQAMDVSGLELQCLDRGNIRLILM